LDELNGVDDEQENEQPLTLYKDEDGEEENEQSLPIHDEAQEVSTLQSTEQFCAARNPANYEKGHGAHYWCPPCNLQKSNSSSAITPVSSAKPQKVANNVSVVLPASDSKPRRPPKKLGNKVGVVYQQLLQSNVKVIRSRLKMLVQFYQRAVQSQGNFLRSLYQQLH